MKRPKGIYILNEDGFSKIYGPDERRDIARLIDMDPVPRTLDALRRDYSVLKDVELVFSGWGGPRLDASLLEAAPNLKVLFYGSGSVGGVLTEAAWDRGVQVTSAYAENAQPVVEYTLAMILFNLKHGLRYARTIRELRAYPTRWRVPGAYGTTVGLISLGMIARLLLDRLKTFDLQVVAYDPFMAPDEAQDLGIELLTLDALFRRCDVVSLHAPLLEETRGMITAAHIDSMKEGATFINTSRGAVVRQSEIVDVLRRRPDLQVVLDVTDPEPPEAGSPLYSLPNVLLTPHIAGSMDDECRRMGRSMVDELKRYLDGEPLRWAVTRDMAKHSSHRPVRAR